LLLLPLVVLGLFPYLVMLSTALKSAKDLFAYPPRILPSQLDFASMMVIWDKVDFARAIANGMVVSVSTTVLTLLFAVPAAYSLARFQTRGSGAIRVFLMVTQMISPVVLIIGIFRMMAAMGMMNDLRALILALTGFSVAFAVWMLQSYFKTLPREIEEAAAVDGANWLTACGWSFYRWLCQRLG
jgi:multiple sugar transport system permease protein